MTEKPFVSRCTGRIPVPSDPKVPWTPELLAQLFPPERRSAWRDVVALTAEQLSTEEPPVRNGVTNGQQ